MMHAQDGPSAVAAPQLGSWIASNARASIALTLLNAASGVLAARALGVDGRGELAAIQVWATQLTPLALLGLGESLVYFAARKRTDAAALTTTAISLGLSGSVLAALIGLAIIPWTLGRSSGALVAAASVFLLYIPLAVVIGLAYCPLRALGDFSTWNLLRTAQAAMWPAVLLLSLLLQHPSAAAISRLYLGGLLLVLILVVARVRLQIPGDWRFSRRHSTELMMFGLPALLATLPDSANFRMDQIFIAAVWGTSPLGLYSVASTWSGAYGTLYSALVFVVLPHVASVNPGIKQREELLRLWRVGLLAALAMAAATAVVAPVAVPLLFGSQFAPASTIAIVLCLPSFCLALRQLLAAGTLGLGRPRSLAHASFLALLINVGLLWLLTPYSFVLGPAIAATAAHAASGLLLLTRIQRSLDAQWSELLPTTSDMSSVWSFLTARKGQPSKSESLDFRE